MKERVVIIGNGIAGISTALELQRLSAELPTAKNLEILVISGESEFHYSRPALMYIFMGHMRYEDTLPYPASFWRNQTVKLKKGWVSEIDTERRELRLSDSSLVSFDRLVIASGSVSNTFGWPGQELDGVQGLYSLQDLELLESNVRDAKRAVIVGGGLIGIEMAEMLHQRGLEVTFLVRETSYWNNVLTEEESQMVNRVIRAEGMRLVLETNLSEILDSGNGRCRAVVTEFGEEIPCDIVGLTPGVSPNKQLAEASGLNCRRGILVDPFFQTSVEGMYAIGDCAEIQYDQERSSIDQLWYTGKMQGIQLARNMLGEARPYHKPVFYNSAKFIDMEYQTYGEVAAPVDRDQHLFWEAKDRRHSIRLVARDGVLRGVTVMGIRYRQEICQKWIAEQLPIGDVLAQLADANFDPEFSKKYESAVASEFRKQLSVSTPGLSNVSI